MPSITSGGVPLTRTRLERALEGTGVVAQFASRNRPWCWTVQHTLARRRQFHPHNRLSTPEFDALCAPGLEAAAVALAQAGYHVYFGPLLTDEQVDQLPQSVREEVRLAGPVLLIVPDDEQDAQDAQDVGEPPGNADVRGE